MQFSSLCVCVFLFSIRFPMCTSVLFNLNYLFMLSDGIGSQVPLERERESLWEREKDTVGEGERKGYSGRGREKRIQWERERERERYSGREKEKDTVGERKKEKDTVGERERETHTHSYTGYINFFCCLIKFLSPYQFLLGWRKLIFEPLLKYFDLYFFCPFDFQFVLSSI